MTTSRFGGISMRTSRFNRRRRNGRRISCNYTIGTRYMSVMATYTKYISMVRKVTTDIAEDGKIVIPSPQSMQGIEILRGPSLTLLMIR